MKGKHIIITVVVAAVVIAGVVYGVKAYKKSQTLQQ